VVGSYNESMSLCKLEPLPADDGTAGAAATAGSVAAITPTP
jgi:hypothetical protein